MMMNWTAGDAIGYLMMALAMLALGGPVAGCDDHIAEAQPMLIGRHKPAPYLGKADTRSRVPPSSERGLIRAPYLIIASNGEIESGYIEAGSWAAAAIVRYVGDAAAHVDDRGDGHLHELTLMVIGPDYKPVTADDRPFRDLADLVKRGRVGPELLGRMLEDVRNTPPAHLKSSAALWNVVEGVVFMPDETRAALRLANRCTPETLAQRVGLSGRARQALIAARPVPDLRELGAIPHVGQVALHRLRYAGRTLNCAGEGTASLFDSPIYQTLRLIYTPSHLNTVVAAAQSDGDVKAATAVLAAELNRPFERFDPATADPDNPESLRDAAVEHLVFHVVAKLQTEIGDWRTLVATRRDTLDADLRRLRRGGWETWEREGDWIVVGYLWGVYCEVVIPLAEPDRVTVRIEFD